MKRAFYGLARIISSSLAFILATSAFAMSDNCNRNGCFQHDNAKASNSYIIDISRPSERVYRTPLNVLANALLSNGVHNSAEVEEASASSNTLDPGLNTNSAILWSADMETGTLDQWSKSVLQTSPCGGEFSGAGGHTVITSKLARSGLWSAKMTIPGKSVGPTQSGTRLHRWCESQRHRELYYSVGYYIPQLYTVERGGWVNWFQFKSKQTGSFTTDPFFFLDISNAPGTGVMRFMLTWWAGLAIDGPFPGQRGYRAWKSSVSLPIGRWFQLEARYVCAGDFSGSIQVWQDGIEIFNLDGVRTRYQNGDCQWGVNNYGTGISPSPITIYVDDATISTKRLRNW